MPKWHVKLIKRVSVIQKAFTLAMVNGDEHHAIKFSGYLVQFKLTTADSIPEREQLYAFMQCYKIAHEYLRSHGEA